MAHLLKRLVFVSLPYQLFSKSSGAGVRFSTLLYLCITGRDLGACICRSVSGSFSRGPNFLNTCLADLSLYLRARVLANDNLNIQIKFKIFTLFLAKE